MLAEQVILYQYSEFMNGMHIRKIRYHETGL